MQRVKDEMPDESDKIMSDAKVSQVREDMDADAGRRRRLLKLADAEDDGASRARPSIKGLIYVDGVPKKECPECGGSGHSMENDEDGEDQECECPVCKGTGVVDLTDAERKWIESPLPDGVPDAHDAIPPNAVSPSIIQMDDVVRCRFGLRPDGLQDLIPCKPLCEHSRSSAPGVTLIMKKFVEKHPRFGARPPQRFGALLRVVEGDQGVLLNWCPFCGENIHRAFKDRARG